MEPKQPKPLEIELPHHSCQPSKAELEKPIHTDKTVDEIVSACLRPVKITYAEPPKRKRLTWWLRHSRI